ncbi:hypothetical protein [Devosia naphthalenivorans]|uniref:hypothetical protein n=1 Tax=Devosia naphthalenivorans TaxID=2082392 RepID=UPI0013B05A81|nr:hypothetical protein [Devosia naphthalenivorans]
MTQKVRDRNALAAFLAVASAISMIGIGAWQHFLGHGISLLALAPLALPVLAYGWRDDLGGFLRANKNMLAASKLSGGVNKEGYGLSGEHKF